MPYRRARTEHRCADDEHPLHPSSSGLCHALNQLAERWPELGTIPPDTIHRRSRQSAGSRRTPVRNNLRRPPESLVLLGTGRLRAAPREPSGRSQGRNRSGLWRIHRSFPTRSTPPGLGRFGSGWAWLVINKDKKLDVISTANQDPPILDGNRRHHRRRCLGARLLPEISEPHAPIISSPGGTR